MSAKIDSKQLSLVVNGGQQLVDRAESKVLHVVRSIARKLSETAEADDLILGLYLHSLHLHRVLFGKHAADWHPGEVSLVHQGLVARLLLIVTDLVVVEGEPAS